MFTSGNTSMEESGPVDPFGRGDGEMRLEEDLFNIPNAYGSRVSVELNSDLEPGVSRLSEVAIVDGWHVIRRDTAGDCPFWVVWLNLGWVVEPPTPIPSLGCIHLMRIVDWDFAEGIWLREASGTRWFIEYPDDQDVRQWWEAFQEHKRQHPHEYFGALREVIQMCLELTKAADLPPGEHAARDAQ